MTYLIMIWILIMMRNISANLSRDRSVWINSLSMGSYNRRSWCSTGLWECNWIFKGPEDHANTSGSISSNFGKYKSCRVTVGGGYVGMDFEGVTWWCVSSYLGCLSIDGGSIMVLYEDWMDRCTLLWALDLELLGRTFVLLMLWIFWLWLSFVVFVFGFLSMGLSTAISFLDAKVMQLVCIPSVFCIILCFVTISCT